MFNSKDLPDCVFYSGSGHFEYAEKVIKSLEPKFKKELSFENTNFEKYPDGEFANRIVNPERIKDKIVVYFCSLYSEELYRETTDIVSAMKQQYGAKHIILVVSFMIYRRQDHEENKIINNIKISEIPRLKYAIKSFKDIGVDEIITVTPHSKKMAKWCLEYGIGFTEIDTSMIIAEKFKIYLDDNSALISPDAGSIERVIEVAKSIDKLTSLKIPVGFFLKTRGLDHNSGIKNCDDNEVQCILEKYRKIYSNFYYADESFVKNKKVFLVDDEAATFNTAKDVANYLIFLGALCVYYAATHPVLIGTWRYIVDSGIFQTIILGDTIPRPYKKQTGGKIDTFSTADQMAYHLYLIILAISKKLL